jgi:Ca-activated chloride channel family protein
VFLVDVSGSMDEPDKLPLAKQALRVLVDHLNAHDTVALVTYASDSRVILPRTSIDDKDRILAAIDHLEPGGSTAMASGIDTAYELAAQDLKPGTISRVVVCTDGDGNVGPHSYDEILKIIEGRAQQGVTLSTIGFGMGNYKDTTMEHLADKGNGNNYYVDSIAAAQRIFGEQLTSTLEVAAKDVKLQFDFDPAVVSRYRLIGYENRDVADKDFRNDKVGGGQIGWGHQVTAMYEVELAHPGAPLGTLRIRHKAPDADASVESPGFAGARSDAERRGGSVESPGFAGARSDAERRGESVEETFAMAAGPADTMAAAPADLRFAFAVAAAADVLRANPDAQAWSLDQIRSLAADAAGADPDRRELVGLLDRVRKLRGGAVAAVAR